ncbi:hypothetical protein INR49_011164 [Caranx melampygus]|nr:hypothetical protein INR49_011164 [Caranx melampygus]
MSAVWIELITLLCLTCTSLCAPESAVVWRNPREDITIQCRVDQEVNSLTLKEGLNKEAEIFFREQKSDKDIIAEDFKNRLQLNGQFPNMDFLIKNLTSADTGSYWCLYRRFDLDKTAFEDIEGKGSMLLVVRDEMATAGSAIAEQGCETRHLNLVLVCVVVSVSVLLCIVVALAWIFFKTRKLCSTVRPSPVSPNDVYEDMRGRHRL